MDLLGSRRSFLTGLSAALAVARTRAATTPLSGMTARVSELERHIGGRIGLAVLDTADGRQFAHRAAERFAMCSTFKLMLAAATLSRVDEGSLRLEQSVRFKRSEILPHSPVSEAHAAAGALSLNDLLQAVVEVSDNTAANHLLALVGGPPGYTAYLRSIGDETTRLDRVEPALNSNLPGDIRDTTTPSAMVEDMRRELLGEHLSIGSRKRLLQWMRDCQTGRDRLRARLPAGWEAGDKTGTGDRGATNDLAIFFPPGRAPILVACYLTGSTASTDRLSAAHAQMGAWVASGLG